jgi:hypothetical protein
MLRKLAKPLQTFATRSHNVLVLTHTPATYQGGRVVYPEGKIALFHAYLATVYGPGATIPVYAFAETCNVHRYVVLEWFAGLRSCGLATFAADCEYSAIRLKEIRGGPRSPSFVVPPDLSEFDPWTEEWPHAPANKLYAYYPELVVDKFYSIECDEVYEHTGKRRSYPDGKIFSPLMENEFGQRNSLLRSIFPDEGWTGRIAKPSIRWKIKLANACKTKPGIRWDRFQRNRPKGLTNAAQAEPAKRSRRPDAEAQSGLRRLRAPSAVRRSA